MKYLKQKLMAATAMLMVSAVMLTSVSYAWFTMSTNPEVTGMTATVTANENLEIALDNGYTIGEGSDVETSVDYASRYDTTTGAQGSTVGNPYTWGNLVDLSTAFKTLNGDDTTKGVLNIQPMKFIAKDTEIDNPEFYNNVPVAVTDEQGKVTGYNTQGKEEPWTLNESAGTYTSPEPTKAENLTESDLNATVVQWIYTPYKAAVAADTTNGIAESAEVPEKLQKVTYKVIAEGDIPTYKWDNGTTTEVAKTIAAESSLLQYPEYNVDGRVSALKTATATLFSAHADFVDKFNIKGEAITPAEGETAVAGGVKAYSATEGKPNYYAFSVDYWIRSNVTGKVYLATEGALRANDKTTTAEEGVDAVVNTVEGNGSYIKIPGDVYGVIKYKKNTDGTLEPMYTEEQQAINDYISNLVVRFEYLTQVEDTSGEAATVADESSEPEESTEGTTTPPTETKYKDVAIATTAKFAALNEELTGIKDTENLHPILKAGFFEATVVEAEPTAEGGTTATTTEMKPVAELVKYEAQSGDSNGLEAGTYYFVNAATTTQEGATEPTVVFENKEAKKATNCEPLYFYLTNSVATAATPAAEDDSEETTYEPVVELKRNVGQKVTMYVYLDGETVSNADALLSDLSGIEFNIQFTHKPIDSSANGAQAVDPRPTPTITP